MGMNILKINGREYVLKYNFRALSEMQERGISFTDEQEFKLKDIVMILHIGMKKFHKEITFDDVFDLMDEILEEMSLEDVMNLISKAMENALGKQKPMPTK
jgi:hypothetical protein